MARGGIERDAVLTALREYDVSGRDKFLADHHFNRANQFYLQHGGRLYDAKAIVNVAYYYQHHVRPDPRISGGRAESNRILADLGFTVVDGRPTDADGERAWRLALWSHLKATNDNLNKLSPKALRAYDAYGGQQGIWVDTRRTAAILPGGVAVGILHTGAHYPDNFSDEGALYRYPKTGRSPGRDVSEINAMKAAAKLRLPIFTSAKPTPSSTWRIARLVWVEGWNDRISAFLLSYDEEAPTELLIEDHSDEEPFILTGSERRRTQRTVTERPGQVRFKLRVFHRYSPRCPLSGIEVPEMLEAAHLRPVAEDGTNDPRNGIPLNAALHGAYDAYLFSFDPDTLDVITVPGGPTLADLRITTPHLRDLPRRPHVEALRWRHAEWIKRHGLEVGSASSTSAP
jgi:hypothetical protein